MKFDFTPDEMEDLQHTVQTNNVHRWFLAKDSLKFEIGDVLLKYIVRYDRDNLDANGEPSLRWYPENINSDAKMAQRYVYVYEDEFGIGYIKQLKVSTGKLGVELFCLTDFNYEGTKFEVDPEYAEHTLLDADFNIKDIHKRSLEARKIIIKMNRKIGTKPQTLKQFNNFFSKLKAGDTVYTTSDYTAKYIQTITITDLKTITVDQLNRENDWGWRRWKERNKTKKKMEDSGVDDTFTYKMFFKGHYGDEERVVTEYNDQIYFTQKPAQEEKK